MTDCYELVVSQTGGQLTHIFYDRDQALRAFASNVRRDCYSAVLTHRATDGLKSIIVQHPQP
jgi:hypothetical protein